MVNSYMLAFGGLLLIMGGLGNRFGRARMLRIGLIDAENNEMGGATFTVELPLAKSSRGRKLLSSI